MMETTTESRKKMTTKIWANYLGDWLLTIGLAGLFMALSGANVDGFRRRFSLDDQSIQYPYTLHERVPNWLLVVLAFVVPLCLMPIINILTIRSLWDLHNSILGLILSLALTGSLSNILKLTAGRPRPDLIARCLPVSGAANPAVFGLLDDSICTQTNQKIMKDGFASFISAHASLSFAGLGFLSFYLAGKLHLFDQRGQTVKAWLFAVPLFGATVISITRTMDYRHHWEDVAVGFVVGLSVAYFSYRQYYPSLETIGSQYPFTPRHLVTGDEPGDRDNTEMNVRA